MKRDKGRVYGGSLGSKAFEAANMLLMCMLMFVMLFPMVQILALSLSDAQNVAQSTVTFYPKGLNIRNYQHVLRDAYVYFGYRNSLIYAGASTLLMLLVTSLMAYPLTVPGFPIKKFLTVFLTITMFFSGGLIPTYLLIKGLGLRNNMLVMILPGCIGAYNVFLFRTFFNNLPAELRESAQLDGASDPVILFRIILPLSKAMLATFALFNIVGVWNSWFNALIYLDEQKLYPLQLVLRDYLFKLNTSAMEKRAGIATSAQYAQQVDFKGVQMAMIVIAVFPIMAVYPFLQKYFVKGVMIGAIKG